MNLEEEEKDLIDINKYQRIILKFWYVGAVVLLISFIVAFYKIRYATPIYMVKTTLQIKDRSSYSSGNKSFLEGSSMFQPFKNLMNEMELIKSYNRIQLVVKELDFTWEYSIKGKLRDIELYHNSPIKLEYNSDVILTNVPFYVTVLNQDSCLLFVHVPYMKMYDPVLYAYTNKFSTPVTLERRVRFGDLITLGSFQFIIAKTDFFAASDIGEEFNIVARDLHYLTKVYKNRITVIKSDKSSIITISSTGPVISKEVAFLNKVSEVYIREELADKNQIASNTISFIDSQLNIISDSLQTSENDIQSFKEKNKIYDVGRQAETVNIQLQDLNNRKLEMELQLRYYEYLKQYLNTDKEGNNLVAPSTMNIQDGILNELVSTLINLYHEKNTLRYSRSEKSQAYQTLLIRIRSTTESLLETTNNLVKNSQSSLADVNARINNLEFEMGKIPDKERKLVKIERRHTINDNIYNYLLQKRAEASIARASNAADAFTVETPREDEYVQIAPLNKSIYMSHLLTGAGICVVLLIGFGKFDNKVNSKEDIQKRTGISVLGNIPYISTNSDDTIVYSGHSNLTESFRSIRTNLQFLLQGKSTFLLGVTSCVSGDGKSFCSKNLARAYAISGKKTLLVRGDLRKKFDPSEFNLPETTNGLSEYLIHSATLDEIIFKGDIDNLSIIISGHVPPNASELFASSQMQEFLQNIKKRFEVVILDSPPVGLVSDYMSVLNCLDVNIYVVRYEHTPKETLNVIKEIRAKLTTASNHTVFFNSVKGNLLGKYSYYNSGYSNEYGKNKKWWRKFF